jgi:hypothetical protein
MIDLDHRRRMREFGTIMLAQTLKQLRYSDCTSPIYENGKLAKGNFANIGVLKYYCQLDV